MTQTLDELLSQIQNENDLIAFSMVSTQTNGISTYVDGSLQYTPSDPNLSNVGSGRIPPALLRASGLRMLFSDRKSAPEARTQLPGESPFLSSGLAQPFDVRSPEELGVSISLGLAYVMTLTLFGTNSKVILKPLGDLFVGTGPSMGDSGPGVFVVAFTAAVINP